MVLSDHQLLDLCVFLLFGTMQVAVALLANMFEKLDLPHLSPLYKQACGRLVEVSPIHAAFESRLGDSFITMVLTVWPINRSFTHEVKEKCPTLEPTKQHYRNKQQ